MAYNRIDVRRARVFWQARPVSVDDQAEWIPTRIGGSESWWHGFTRQHAIARAYRWAKRQNRLADRRSIETIEFGE